MLEDILIPEHNVSKFVDRRKVSNEVLIFLSTTKLYSKQYIKFKMKIIKKIEMKFRGKNQAWPISTYFWVTECYADFEMILHVLRLFHVSFVTSQYIFSVQ